MKLVKQPFFLIGVGAVFCAIVIAIVGTVMKPSSSLIRKYEKAWNEEDDDLFEECFSPELDNDQIDLLMLELTTMESLFELLEIDADDVEYQILVGKEVEVEKETEAVESTEDEEEIETVKSIPAVVVVKEDGEVVYVYSEEFETAEIDGKEYLYTGLE